MASPGIFPKQIEKQTTPTGLPPCRENGQNQIHISIIEITVPRTYTVRVCVCICVSVFAVLLFLVEVVVALDTRIRIIRRIISGYHCHVHYLFI